MYDILCVLLHWLGERDIISKATPVIVKFIIMESNSGFLRSEMVFYILSLYYSTLRLTNFVMGTTVLYLRSEGNKAI